MDDKLKCTPGPWKVRTGGTMTGRGPEVYAEGPHYDDGSEFVVADCGCSEATGGGLRRRWKRQPDADMIEANARLIAAAPEMYRFLDAIVNYRNGPGAITGAFGLPTLLTLIAEASELLAKARGGHEPHP